MPNYERDTWPNMYVIQSTSKNDQLSTNIKAQLFNFQRTQQLTIHFKATKDTCAQI